MQVLRNRRCDLPYYHLLVSEQRHQTRKKRQTRKLAEDSDIIPVGNQMEIDVKPVVPRVRDLDVNFVDDDELQAALASSRRAKVKAKKISPEEIARRSQFYPM
jgi:U4/U6.U5 tri-snRNP-associated protein 1